MPLHSRPLNQDDQEDAAHFFFMEAHQTSRDARFLIDSLPNVEMEVVERTIRDLHSIRSVLVSLEDTFTSPEEKVGLLSAVDDLLNPLEDHLNQPQTADDIFPGRSTTHTGGRGRPSYNLDLQRACRLHDLGNTWADIAESMGVCRRTLYNHLNAAGLSSSRPEHTNISDEDLDTIIAEISEENPFIGSVIMQGHLQSRGLNIPLSRVYESFRRVDAIGVKLRWGRIIKRRVYKVRGSNALWHMDGNEKLRPWGFYVHGCIDGYSRLILYLKCSGNKRAATVSNIFLEAVEKYGWPSRMCGDFGTENNGVEQLMKEHWGDTHRAYLRGRSTHNVRIERLWRDIRKDCLESYQQVFMHLEEIELLDMANPTHRACLFLVFRDRIQKSLDRARDAWNHHKLSTERMKAPVALYELSRQRAITRGYWTTDAGDNVSDVDDDYGFDESAPLPPADELKDDPLENHLEDADNEGGLADEIRDVIGQLQDFNFSREDSNWGINVYAEALRTINS